MMVQIYRITGFAMRLTLTMTCCAMVMLGSSGCGSNQTEVVPAPPPSDDLPDSEADCGDVQDANCQGQNDSADGEAGDKASPDQPELAGDSAAPDGHPSGEGSEDTDAADHTSEADEDTDASDHTSETDEDADASGHTNEQEEDAYPSVHPDSQKPTDDKSQDHTDSDSFEIAVDDSDFDKISVSDLFGVGYSAIDHKLRAPCVDGYLHFAGNSQQTIDTYLVETFDRQMQQSWGRLGAGFNVFLFGASGSVEYLSRTTQTDYSLTLMMRYDTQLGSVVLLDRNLSPKGQAVSQLDAYDRFAHCGDSFIHRASLGSKLFIGASLHFGSREELQRFIVTIRVSLFFGLISKSSQFVRETSHKFPDAYISVHAYQAGGNPRQLYENLGGKQQISCRLADSQHCTEALDRLVEYASDPEQYGSQLELLAGDSESMLDQLAVLAMYPALYEESGHDELSSPLASRDPSPLPTVPQWVYDEYSKLSQASARIEIIVDHQLQTPQQLESLARLYNRIEKRRRQYEDYMSLCKHDPSHCANSDSLLRDIEIRNQQLEF